MRVVFDSNVFVSALLKPDGLPWLALALTRYDGARLLMSSAIFAELQRVFFDKFMFDPERALSFLAMLAEHSEAVSPKRILNAVLADPSDNRILECAVEGKADAIVSGDHHLLDLKKFGNIPILTVREFVDIVHKK